MNVPVSPSAHEYSADDILAAYETGLDYGSQGVACLPDLDATDAEREAFEAGHSIGRREWLAKVNADHRDRLAIGERAAGFRDHESDIAVDDLELALKRAVRVLGLVEVLRRIAAN